MSVSTVGIGGQEAWLSPADAGPLQPDAAASASRQPPLAAALPTPQPQRPPQRPPPGASGVAHAATSAPEPAVVPPVVPPVAAALAGAGAGATGVVDGADVHAPSGQQSML